MGLGSRIQDPGSGILKKHIPDPGSRGQKGTGSGSATLFLIILISLAKAGKISNDILSLVIWFILESRLIMETIFYSSDEIGISEHLFTLILIPNFSKISFVPTLVF
jgi:hypothetical protein